MASLFFGLLLLALAHFGASQPEPERSALLALYKSTDGAGWVTQWDTSAPTLCTGTGIVQCWPNGKVRRLYLSKNNLVGSLPTEIGLLTSVDTMILSYNSLSGTLPTEIGLIVKMGSFSVAYNSLTGSLPTELGLLNKLSSLLADNNQFSGNLPTAISNHPSITTIRLTTNKLSGQLPNIWAPQIKTIQMEDNAFSGTIPPSIFANVGGLRLQNNQLTGNLPVEAGTAAPKMTEFYVFSNSLTGTIPTELALAPSLQRFWAYFNELSGPIPSEFGQTPNLMDLRLQNNLLSGKIPTQLANSKTLQSFWISDNPLTGEIPSELGSITSLRSIRLAGTQLEGHVPGPVLRLPNLNLLQLSRSCLGPVESYASIATNDYSTFQLGSSCSTGGPYPNDALTRSPLVAYQFSSSGNLVDSSANANPLVVSGSGTIYQAIPVGQYRNPHNTGVQIQSTQYAFKSVNRLGASPSFTVELLFIAPTLASGGDLFSFSTGAPTAPLLLLRINNDGSLTLFRNSGTVIFQTAAGILQPLLVNHVAVTYESGPRTVTLYLNGVQRQQTSLASSITGNFYLFLGGASSVVFDEVAVYGSAFSAPQVQARVALLGWCPAQSCLGACSTTITGYTCS